MSLCFTLDFLSVKTLYWVKSRKGACQHFNLQFGWQQCSWKPSACHCVWDECKNVLLCRFVRVCNEHQLQCGAEKDGKKNMTGTTRHQVISCFSGALFVLEIQQNLKQALSDLSEKASKTFSSKEDKGRMDLAVFWEVFPFYNLI